MKLVYTLLLLVFCSLISYGQESIIKDFAESRRDLKYCLYPSTLRMVNLKKDPSFNEAVSGIKKLLVYKLDSATTASKEYLIWVKAYPKHGFEEYLTMNGAMDLLIYGKKEEFVGLSGSGRNIIAFYLKGEVALQKVPELIRNFDGSGVLSLITNQLNE